MREIGRMRWTWVVCAGALLCASPSARAPVSPRGPVAESAARERAPTPEHPGTILPWQGRMELRLLISRRLKLVLDYRPIAYC